MWPFYRQRPRLPRSHTHHSAAMEEGSQAGLWGLRPGLVDLGELPLPSPPPPNPSLAGPWCHSLRRGTLSQPGEGPGVCLAFGGRPPRGTVPSVLSAYRALISRWPLRGLSDPTVEGKWSPQCLAWAKSSSIFIHRLVKGQTYCREQR